MFSVVGAVALDEAVAHELALDRRDRAEHALVVGGQEADQRHQEAGSRRARSEP